MSRPWKVTLALVLILACGVGWFVFQLFGPSPPIVVSKQTTYLTEPLADDGLPDYAAYLLAKGREGVTVENNGAVPLLYATWPAGMGPDEQRVICEELGMAMPTEEGITSPYGDSQLLQELQAWVKQQLPSDPSAEELATEPFFDEEEREAFYVDQFLGVIESRAWQRSDCSPLADWIDRHAAHFDLLHEAAKRPEFYFPAPGMLLTPLDEWTSFLLPAPQTVRSGASLPLELRAFLHLGEGRAAEAWSDCRVIYSLARHLDHSQVVGELVAISVETRANQLALAILDSPHLTEQVASEVRAFLENLPPRDTMIDVIEVEARLGMLNSLLLMSGQRLPDTIEQRSHGNDEDDWTSKLSFDWNLILRFHNDWHTQMIEAMKAPTWEEREAASEAVATKLAESEVDDLGTRIILSGREQRSRWLGWAFLPILFDSYPPAMSAEDRANAYLQLHTVAAALAVYRVEHGEYPDTLDTLVPDQLDSPPVDLFHRHPLVYRRTDQGYLLYSLGANGTDDGGSHEMEGRYQGYKVDLYNEPFVRKALGLPPASEPPAEEIPLDEEDLTEEEKLSLPLGDQIPPGADDFGIRLPLPKVEFPLP